MGKILREKIVEELTEKYKDTENCVFLDYTGLDVEKMDSFRRLLKKNSIDLFVVKNSLLKIAMERVELPLENSLFLKPTAILARVEDPIAMCKILVDWQKKSGVAEIKGGILDRAYLNKDQVVELSKLPSKEVMLSQILGLFIAPMTDIANLLNTTLSQFASLVQNHSEKLEKAQGAESGDVESDEAKESAVTGAEEAVEKSEETEKPAGENKAETKAEDKDEEVKEEVKKEDTEATETENQ